MFLLFFHNVFILPKIVSAQQHPQEQHHFVSNRVEGLDAAKIIGTPRVKCNTKWLTLDLETNVPFQGRIYVNGKAFDRRCSAQFLLNQSTNATVQIPIMDCANLEELNKGSDKKDRTSYLVWVDVRVDFHPIFITNTSQVFRAECAEVGGLDYGEEEKTIGSANTICTHEVSQVKDSNEKNKERKISSGESLSISKFSVGDHVWHRWYCSNDFTVEKLYLGTKKYAILLHNCEVISRSKQVVQVVDKTGCIVDEQLMKNLRMTEEKDKPNKEANNLVAIAESKMFKFLEEKELRFKCSLLLIPRSLNNAPIKLPKCTVTKEELVRKAASNISDFFQFINPNKRFIDVIETTTLTEWIRVSERLVIANYDKVFPIPLMETEFSLQQNKKEMLMGTADISVQGSTHTSAPVSKIEFDEELHKNMFDYQDANIISNGEKEPNEGALYHLQNSKISKAILEHNTSVSKQTTRILENALLNRTNSSKKVSKDPFKDNGCAITGSNTSILIHKLRRKLSNKHTSICSWRVLNSAILVWSIASSLVWLALLTRNLYKYAYESRESYLQSLTATTSPSTTTNVSPTTASSRVPPLSRWQRNVNMGKAISNTQNRPLEGGYFRPTYGRFSSLRMD